MRSTSRLSLLLCFALPLALLLSSCRDPDTITQDNSQPLGWDMMAKLPGKYNGPLQTGTSVGNFSEWPQDFRPINGSTVMSKSELDNQNDITLAFYLATYGGKKVLMLRNGGYFGGRYRISYAQLDSASTAGTTSWYRFTDIKSGESRISTELTFSGDSLRILTHVNGNMHFDWRAKRLDTDQARPATQLYSYPDAKVVREMTDAFSGPTGSTFYSKESDPFPIADMQTTGNLKVNVTLTPTTAVANEAKAFVILTTSKLYFDFLPQPAVLNAKSRFVTIPFIPTQTSGNFTFGYVHPGTYYVNVIVDRDNSGGLSNGDAISLLNADTEAVVSAGQLTTISAVADYLAP